MKRTRYRQLFLFLVVLILPSAVIAGLGWILLGKQREIEANQWNDARKREILGISRAVLDQLDSISSYAPPGTAASSGHLVFVGWLDELGGLMLPWQDATSFRRFSFSDLEPEVSPLLYEAQRAEREKNYDRAASLYLQAQSAREESSRAFAHQGQARALVLSGDHSKGRDVYRQDLLSYPSTVVDEFDVPFAWWAATALVKSRTADGDILDRIDRDINGESPIALTPKATEHWRQVVGILQKSGDAEVRARAEAAEEDLAARARFLQEMLTLQESFSSLGVTTASWQHYREGEAMWLIRTVIRADSPSPLVVAVRAPVIFKAVESDHTKIIVSGTFDGTDKLSDYTREATPSASISVGGTAGDPLGEPALPDVRVSFLNTSAGERVGLRPAQRFYALSILFVMGMTFLAGHLVWRDTHREIRVSEMRSQFVSSVSHELKTPLTSIRMFAELLQMRVADSQTQTEYLNTIVNESERLTRLLNNVLDFSRIEHGQRHYRLEPTRLDEVVHSATRVMEYPLNEQGFDLRVSIDRSIPQVDADRDALKQAILNLLTNAMKYSGKSRAIELRVVPQNGSAVIQVSDHGIGIPKKEQARIFEKFYRANVPENHAISGTGLGLALVAHIANAHHGSIHVESNPGGGSTFSIHLPLRTERAP